MELRDELIESMELGKQKMKHLEPRMWYDEQLWKEETRSLGRNNNKNYVMPILHQFKLMTSNRFGILLILVERIKIDIVQTWEGLQWSTGRIETMNKSIWEHRNRSLEQTAIRIKKTNKEKIAKHWEELENERRYLRGFRYMRTKRSWTD